jgi:hypothetical protein
MPEPVIFDPPLYPKKVSVASGVWNLRAAMAANNAVTVYGQLTTEWQTMNVSVVTNPANGYEWYKYEQNGTVGYFADTDRLRWASVDTPTPPETDDEFIKALAARIDAQDIVIDALTAQITELLTEVQLDIPVGDITFTTYKFMLPMIASQHLALGYLHTEISKQALRADGELLSEDVDKYLYSTVTPDLRDRRCAHATRLSH